MVSVGLCQLPDKEHSLFCLFPIIIILRSVNLFLDGSLKCNGFQQTVDGRGSDCTSIVAFRCRLIYVERATSNNMTRNGTQPPAGGKKNAEFLLVIGRACM